MLQVEPDQIDKEIADAKAAATAAEKQVATVGTEQHIGYGWDRTTVLTLSGSLLIFSLIVLGLMAFLIIRTRRVEPILRAFGVPLIITAAVFLVVTGFSDQQISPVVGLLGTIAGYLLGKTDERHLRPPQEDHKVQEPPKGNES